MPSFFSSWLLLLPFSFNIINFVDARPRATKISPRQSTDEPCSQVFNATDDYEIFYAALVYDCLISAPFNSSIALDFLHYYNDTLQFQSTLEYLKNPPRSYQQPAVDVIGSFNNIAQRIQAGEFKNEYTFEVAVQEVIHAAHDDHLILDVGILSAFTFGSPLRIVSASTDGIELPKIYILDDLLEATDQNVNWKPSAVANINGEDVIKYLTQYAVIHSPGNVEPHADWNEMMSSAAGDVQGIYSSFEGSSIFYPGENITFKFENGSDTGNLPWLAFYSNNIIDDPPSLSSGQDLYNYFIFGELPVTATIAAASTLAPAAASTSVAAASTTAAEAAATTTGAAEATPSSWDYPNFYPEDPIVAQPNLGNLDGGVITGYFLNDGVTAILSIPSFDISAEAVGSFSSTIGEFIGRSKAAGKTRCIIDLQRNDGGSALLATDAFKQFFPSVDPFGGNRLRAHPLADAIGDTFTTYYTTQEIDPDFYEGLSADIWVAPVYLNAATGQNFTSWPEFYGPHVSNGGLVTTTQRNNLSSIIFSENASGDGDRLNGIVVYGYGNRTATSPQPYAPEQLVLLTDAFCSSACASFVELMHHESAVRTVVVGGRPEHGPMQAVGGTRGAQAYTTVDIDEDILIAELFNTSVGDVLPDRSVGNYVNFAQFNVKDSVRKGEDFPLQFAYEAATCRIFYTQHTVINYLNLWNYVVDAIWRNPSLCVDGSADGTTILPTNTTGPAINRKESVAEENEKLGNLILTGLDNGPVIDKPDSRKHKREVPTPTTSTAPNPALASHEINNPIINGLVNVNSCSACTSRPGYICANVPRCTNGQTPQTKSCERSCRFSTDCGMGGVCLTRFGPGFCQSAQAALDINSCGKTPTRAARSQTTKAVGGGNFNLPYSRTGQKLHRPN